MRNDNMLGGDDDEARARVAHRHKGADARSQSCGCTYLYGVIASMGLELTFADPSREQEGMKFWTMM